jgi:hypothetical protein
MLKEVNYIQQLSFLDRVPLLDSSITKEYDSSLNEFYEKTVFDAMRTIGEIYVPRFSEENHKDVEKSALCVYVHKDEIVKGTFTEKDPEFVRNSQNRITYLYMAQAYLDVPNEARSIPVTFLASDENLKKDLRNVLNPVYSNMRKDAVSLVHHEYGRDLKKLEEMGASTSLMFDRVNRMTMSNGFLHQEQGSDMMIGWMLFRYCQKLGSRAKNILKHNTSTF